ncbi:MAG: tetratricopeptide repeat protein, partial [Polyangiaceae bacterium]
MATKLKVTLDDDDPAACAEKIAGAIASRPLIAPMPWIGTWDRAVLEELARIEAPLTIFFTMTAVGSGPDLAALGADIFDIGADLDADGQRRWFAAAADDAQRARSTEDLAALDAWWSSAEHATISVSPDASSLPVAGAELFVSLALAARAWPVGRISHLAPGDTNASGDTNAALAALSDAGATTNERGWIAIAPAWSALADSTAALADRQACGRVAGALLTSFDDPWSLAVAADLLVRQGDADRAEATHALALSRARDSLVRREVVARWSKTTATLPADVRLAQCIRAGMRSLDAGEAEEAYRWAKGAASIEVRSSGKDAAVSLLLGQAAVATGDFVTARVALEKAREVASSETKEGAETKALIAAELSEIAYATEDFETATKEAHAALPSAVASTRLKARNTLGKVLLGQSKWEEAEAHFAEDVCYAVTHRAQGKQAQVAELRARLNRGIAILSRNRIEEAKAIFESVLHDGELLHEPRACAYAYENLAVAAMWRHDYGDALALLERACKLRNSLGDRVTIAYDLGNLAHLRYKLGLFEQTDHAVTFGRRVLGPGMPQNNSARFSMEAARLALSRGRTVEAQREIARAIHEGESAGHRTKLAGEAYRLAARIALEDGDVARARANLTKAEAFNQSDES